MTTPGPTRRVRWPLQLLLLLLVGLAVAPFPQPPAAASCSGPYLQVEDRPVLERGAPVSIEGRSFVDGCRDSMACSTGLGCDSCEYSEPPETPLREVTMRLVQQDRSWSLGTEDAEGAEDGYLGRVTWTFEVPLGGRPGRAQLVADQMEPVRIRIR